MLNSKTNWTLKENQIQICGENNRETILSQKQSLYFKNMKEKEAVDSHKSLYILKGYGI